jgi:hypothetical protein
MSTKEQRQKHLECLNVVHTVHYVHNYLVMADNYFECLVTIHQVQVYKIS